MQRDGVFCNKKLSLPIHSIINIMLSTPNKNLNLNLFCMRFTDELGDVYQPKMLIEELTFERVGFEEYEQSSVWGISNRLPFTKKPKTIRITENKREIENREILEAAFGSENAYYDLKTYAFHPVSLNLFFIINKQENKIGSIEYKKSDDLNIILILRQPPDLIEIPKCSINPRPFDAVMGTGYTYDPFWRIYNSNQPPV